MNEEGEIIEAEHDVPDVPDMLDQMDGQVEVGLEEEQFEPKVSHLNTSVMQQNKLRDMFSVHQDKKFDALGGANQEIGLNQFAIRKHVDVKRLKT